MRSGEEEEKKEEEEEKSANIKSNNPHLAGGEFNKKNWADPLLQIRSLWQRLASLVEQNEKDVFYF